MRRGFKTQAERISHEVRDELGLTPHDRLRPEALAEHLAIPVKPVTELLRYGADAAAIQCVLGDAMRFSAVTVFRGTRCCIFYNPHHPTGRQANSLAHELAHVILEHTPSAAITDDGLRNWNTDHEDEADWLAGVLLVPREGALRWMAYDGTPTAGAEHFGVSAHLFNWRVHHTGVVRQLKRRAAVR